jgi:hypothetical protein
MYDQNDIDLEQRFMSIIYQATEKRIKHG